MQYKKRVVHQTSTLSENINHQFNSSSESVCSYRSRGKQKGRAHNNSQSTFPCGDIIPEVARELRFIQKPLTKHKLADDRFVLVSARGVPFLVFSSLPYSKEQRTSWLDLFLL